MIRLRFVSHPGIFSSLVRYAQFGFPQTHCEALGSEGGVIGSWYSGGVQIKPVGYDAGAFSHEMLINLEATAAQQAAFYGFLTSQLGKPYDALAIVAFAAGRDWQEPDSWFCSELIAAAMVEAGLFPPLLAATANKVTVKDAAFIAAAKAG
jgi:uncharacterized protein YycO